MKKKLILLALILALLIGYVVTVLVVGSSDYDTLHGWQKGLHAILHREELLNTEFKGTASDYVWSETDEYRLEDHVVIQKDPNKDFVIMNVTDIHMSDFTQDAVTNNRNLENIRRKAKELQPDLITLSGDLFWTQMTDGSVYHSVHRLTEFMDSLGIPWAPVFGNHDDEGNCDKNYLAEVMMEGKYCVMQKGDASMGVGNYIVNVCEGDKIVHSVILFDSHNGNLWDNQLGWYRWAIEGVKTLGGDVKSSVVLHVPFAQYVYAYEEAWNGEGWKDGYAAFGRKGEDTCCETDDDDKPIDNGFFALIKELDSTTNVLCGHDHANSYSILYDGVRLTYSLRLGYGAGSFEFDLQGVTTITIGSDGNGTAKHQYMYPYDVTLP